MTFSARKRWEAEVKDDASGFSNLSRRSPRRAAVAHARRSRENKEPIQLGVGSKPRSCELRLKRRRYAVRFPFDNRLRQRTGVVFLAVAALGIFISGCNKSQATTATPGPEVEVSAVEQRDVPVYSEWVATLDGYVNAQIRPQVSGIKESDPSSSNHTIRFFGNSLKLILTDGSIFPQKCKIPWADRQVDPNTGTIRIVAAFPNPGNILRPGQYGRVRVETSMKKGAPLLPQNAAADSQGSHQVAVVGSDRKISMRAVKSGATVGTMWVIDEGLKPGEQVVVEGLQKLKDGALVTAKPVRFSEKGN